ncbi:MAG TPA: hypothetical protein ENK18_23735 [Deltaproteobacteria bacterium]|nr:hypothetical protein [Deltaproteobacteria bacterium]
MLTTTLLTLLSLEPPALAEDAPEFLLADLGVRIDFPPGPWRMTKWSDWDFKAEHTAPSGTVLFFAWATPIQVPIEREPGTWVGEIEGWGQVYVDKIEELEGSAPAVARVQTETIAGRPVALVDATFTFGEGGAPGVLRGATLEIVGQDLHLATISSARSTAACERQLRALVERLDFHTEPEPGRFGTTVEAKGITSRLPEGWRPPLDSELATLNASLQGIGVDDFTPCWTALRPVPGGPPDVMATCQGGLLLGVVDEHSFEAVEPVVRERMFGAVEVEPAELIQLEDRVGFSYTPRDGLAVGVVPYDQGVSRTWVLGQGELSSTLEAVLVSSTFSGPHPASLGDQLSYWLVHRTTSPMVLCPLGGCVGAGGLLGLGLLGMMMRGSRDKYADFEPD